MRASVVIVPVLSVLCLAVSLSGQLAGLPAGVTNSQPPGDRPLTPEQALARITLPKGFTATLFAAEPQLLQPIAFDFDDRGRVWVAECFSYPDYNVEGRDRILIFTDTDNDGRFDERKVFLSDGKRISGLTTGFGGVWVASVPHLLFYPDRNGDDVPDAQPEVLLDGWTDEAAHNMVNGLAWGPDGWLYGRHGITAPSFVGRPGTPDKDRVKLSCSIWRYHPVTRRFEVVAHGTTNPWGLDWDDYGQPFFSNNVLAHLWHLVPGARYKRMFGEDYNPYAYGLLNECTDHLHWAGGDWTKSRGGQGMHGELGGGHSHAGAMIYLGGTWPAEYRNRIFMANIHGNRVLADSLHRQGSGYVAKHTGNFLMANDPWFRGVSIQYGPDGNVYVSDWNDLGECHDTDGSYRASGRLYKVSYTAASGTEPERNAPVPNVSALRDTELVKLQLHTNDWFVRRARRVLQERHAAGKLQAETVPALRQILSEHKDATRRLRALWALHSVDATKATTVVPLGHPPRRLQANTGAATTTTSLLSGLLRDKDEHIRWWAVQLLSEDGKPSEADLKKFAMMAHSEESPMVRLALASVLQRIDLKERWNIARPLAVDHPEDARDANLPLMIWYGVEPLVPLDHARALQIARDTRIPVLREFIARRVAEQHE